jgi:mannose-1-phosphate guanylyltransferase / mannose-6-phosphate isomerase
MTKHSAISGAAEDRRVHRPWGWDESIHGGPGFQVKQIMVAPGGRLSLQKHAHRSEHWVVVSGVADVHLDGDQRLMPCDQSIYIPVGSVHRLANASDAPLQVIEIQTGQYLGEDDIIRLEDAYGRV